MEHRLLLSELNNNYYRLKSIYTAKHVYSSSYNLALSITKLIKFISEIPNISFVFRIVLHCLNKNINLLNRGISKIVECIETIFIILNRT